MAPYSVNQRRRRGAARGTAPAAWLVAAALAACGGGDLSPDQRQARWHNSQGVVFMDQHNYARGREEFERALRLDPDYPTALSNLGIALYSLGKYDSARVSLQTCLERSPDHPHANYTLGLIDHAQGRDGQQALESFRKVAARDPDDPLVHYYLGRSYSKLGHADSAVAEFHRAISLDANNVSAYYALANELRQQGDLEEWRRTLETFNQLSQAGAEGVSSSYQGQGKYAEAVADAGFGRAGRDRTGILRFEAVGRLDGVIPRLRFLAAADADGDGRTDLVAGGDGPALYVNQGGGRFLPSPAWTFALGGAVPSALRFADLDDDGDRDAVLVDGGLLVALQDGQGEGQGTGRFARSDQVLGRGLSGLACADADHDGDTDLLGLGEALQLWSNDGTGAFAQITTSAGLDQAGGARAAVFSDFDDDRDVDFAVLGDGLSLFSNNRDGTFADVAARRGLVEADTTGRALAVADLMPDGAMDIAVLTESGARVFAGTGTAFTRRQPVAASGASGLAAADLDNDGDLDLVFHGAAGVQAAAGTGDGYAPVAPVHAGEASRLLVEDVDSDGRLDLVAGAQVLVNRTEAGTWLAVGLAGLNSSPDGFGAKVEVKTSQGLQKQELRGGPADPAVLHFGLGEADSVEFVRILWPSGVRQTELATRSGQRLTLAELNRKGTSCPILYAWDGTAFRFVSDFLGGAIIGYLTAPGQYYQPDTDEYLALRGLAPRDGRYALQVGNQLEEIVYLDAAELVAVDHPEGTELYPNERLLSGPPYPEFRPYPLDRTRPVTRAVDGQGRDATASLTAVDDVWYEGFRRSRIHGYAEEHSLVLHLGDLQGWDHPVLLAHGWVDYAHSTSNWAAAQQDLELTPPRLESSADGGDWRLVTGDMGCPAGLPKTMLYDLQGVFPAGCRDARLRITTSTPVYWDQFRVGRVSRAQPVRVHRRPFDSADLHWRGYPEHTAIRGTFAFRYHYDRVLTDAPWGTHGGMYTRFGDVAELVAQVDDRFAIMFHGDELTLQVAASAFPPLEPGWERTFLLYADGFGKDMDFHSAHSLTVEPLPFHGMSQYPYPPEEHYPTTPQHADYVLNYNTRWVKGHYR